MKKALFLAVFSVFVVLWGSDVSAWQRQMRCSPQVNPVGNQLNWIDERGGLHVGHHDSASGFWAPAGCDRRFAEAEWQDYLSRSYSRRYDPRYDSRHDRRDRRYDSHGSNGGDVLTNALASFLGAFAGSAVGNQVQQPAPVYTPPQPVYTPPPPVVSAPPPVYTAPTADRRCSLFRVTGDNQEVVWAVERALRSRGYGISSSGCEIAVRYEEVGDPQARIFLRVTDANGRVSHTDGAQFFKRGDTLARADAIAIAARTAVSGI